MTSRPSAFSYNIIGGRPRTSIVNLIHLDAATGALTATRTDRGGDVPEVTAQHTPSDASWGLLRDALQGLGAGRWLEDYRPGRVFDGAPYHLETQWPELQVNLHGNSGGPPGWPVISAMIHALAQGEEERVAKLAPNARPLAAIERAIGPKRHRDEDRELREAARLVQDAALYLALGEAYQPRHVVAATEAVATARASLDKIHQAAFDVALDALIAAAPERAVELGLVSRPASAPS